MLLRILKYNSTPGYLMILLLTLVAWWPSFNSLTGRQSAFDHAPMPLYDILARFIAPYELASTLMAMGLVLFLGFYLLRINTKYSLLRERALLPAFFFILIVSSITFLHRLHPVLIAMLFFLPAVDKLLSSYKTERLSYNYFEASFLIGAGSLFYFNLIYFIVIVWAALLILRPVIWREWALSIMGIITPWFFFFLSDYLINESVHQSIEQIIRHITYRYDSMLVFLPEIIFFSILLLLIIFASRRIIISMAKMRVLTRKIYVLFFWVFILGTIIYFFIETADIEMVVPAALPVSFLLSNFLLSLKRGFWSNLILWCFISVVQINVWLPLI
jgi:hypothetical protein